MSTERMSVRNDGMVEMNLGINTPPFTQTTVNKIQPDKVSY